MARYRAGLAGVVLLFVACCVIGQTGAPNHSVVVTRDPIISSTASPRLKLLDSDRHDPPTTVVVSRAIAREPRASRAAVRPRPMVAVDDAFWRRVANCESPSNRRSANGKWGGYFQMTQQAWHGGGGDGVPESHSYDEQLAVAKRWASMTNPWRQWPVCWPRASRG